MPPEIGERVATLEAESGQCRRERDALFDRMDERDATLEEIRKDVAHIKEAFARYKGWVGGAAFVLSSLGAVVGAVAMSIWERMTGGH